MFENPYPNQEHLFDYYSPFKKYIGIVSIPHSGEAMPDELKQYLYDKPQDFKSDVDYKVNELVDIKALQEAGIAVIVAKIHRVVVDLNRDPENSILYWKKNTQGVELVKKSPTEDEKRRFIATYHAPYFEMLKSMIHHLEKAKTPASFVDLHSMPSRPTAYHMSKNPKQKQTRPQFCISDRHGLTCEKTFIDFIENSLKDKGYTTTRNDPYVGGYVTEHVNQYQTNNIQVEINREIYMDETKKQLIQSKVNDLKPKLTNSLIDLFNQFA
jgi:N-formylglutamate amidohydrolase